jgi:hypothetical protein
MPVPANHTLTLQRQRAQRMRSASWFTYLNLYLLDQERGCTSTGRFYKRLSPSYGKDTQGLCEICRKTPVYMPTLIEPLTLLQFCGLQARPTENEIPQWWLRQGRLKDRTSLNFFRSC